MTSNQKKHGFGIAVVGGGLVGSIAALMLADVCAKAGKKLVFIAPAASVKDKRTTAMLMPSIRVLESLGLWERIKPHTAPLSTMRLIDASKRLIRAPVTDFRSTEMGLEAFGYNIPNDLLLEVLGNTIDKNPNIQLIPEKAGAARTSDNHISIKTTDGKHVTAALAVAADGRHSLLRQEAGISCRDWSYPQTAVVLTFSHKLPHAAISTEFHTETGPFTQVPLPPLPGSPHRSSLVWMVTPAQAEALMAKDLNTLSLEIERQMQSCFGKCRVEEGPQSFPMSGMTAHSFGLGRTVLVGEAGHVFPPIGAQGFNLGLRDVTVLEELLSAAHSLEKAESLAHAYSGKRKLDVSLRTAGVDLMNRSLLTGFLPVQMMRAGALSALGAFPRLRKIAMQQGLGG